MSFILKDVFEVILRGVPDSKFQEYIRHYIKYSFNKKYYAE